MLKVNDPKLMDKFIEKYGIKEIFTGDIKPYLELLFFKKNEFICKEKEEINYLHFVVKGKAKVYTTLSNGKSLLICFYEDFRVLGDIEVFDLRSASTNIKVIEDTYCLSISFVNARRYLLNDAKFLRFLCTSLGDKLTRSSTNSSINLLYPLEDRLSSYILATGERLGDSSNSFIEFNENLTEIAELLGTSYRHLLRTLNGLCSKNILKKVGHSYVVIDEQRLKKLAAELYK